MADRKLNIILGIKSEMASGLASAKGALESFGTSAMNIGKTLAAGFVAGAAALTAFATKALTSYAEQEKATSSLKASLRAYGDEIEVNTAAIKAQASAIQDETGVSDDALVARAAKLKMLGVETEALGDALKATVALAQFGLEEEMAVRAVANAREGNFSALERYIPALRSAATETEKQIVLNDFLARGYDAQKETLGTLAGQWGLLKERVGDAWEEVGAAIAQNGTLMTSMESASAAVKSFGESVNTWVTGGGIENTMSTVQYFGAEIVRTFSIMKNAIAGNVMVIWDMAAPLRYVGNLVVNLATAVAGFIDYSIRGFTALGQAMIKPWDGFKPPDAGPMIQAIKDVGSAFVDTEMFKMTGLQNAKEESKRIEEDYAAKILEIQSKQLAALDQVNRTRIQNEANALNASVQNNIAAQNSIFSGEKTKVEKINEQVEIRAEKENDVLLDIKDVNLSTADAVSSSWDDAYSSIADSSIAAADVAIKSANAIKESMSDGPKGGTIETSASYNAAKLKAAGLDPNMASGTVLSGNEAMNLKNVTQDAILRELEQMNANQQKLLTMG